jgi:hypothetical protein
MNSESAADGQQRQHQTRRGGLANPFPSLVGVPEPEDPLYSRAP